MIQNDVTVDGHSVTYQRWNAYVSVLLCAVTSFGFWYRKVF